MTYDIIVIGGGINGAGIARDAALRGLKVCLLEAEDWGAGTSAKSSMLAHGGLRYLEQFELRLVREALQDRELMFRHAPHLVRPLEFVYPLYPDTANRRTVRAGMWLYDQLSKGKSVPRRGYLASATARTRIEKLQPENLEGAATYFDGQFTHVERFVAELIWSAKQAGAHVHNHTKVTKLLFDESPEGAGRRCVGVTTDKGDSFHATHVVNAAGPWVDAVLGTSMHQPTQLIRGTKGAHIVVKKCVDKALILRTDDGRTFFILPWQDVTLIGTTDTDDAGEPRDCRASPEDIEYLIRAARRYVPDADLTPIWTYAGIRPLLNQRGLTESNITRRHVIHDHRKDALPTFGLWSLQGGKLTTYRALAEAVVTKLSRHYKWVQPVAKQDDARAGSTATAGSAGRPASRSKPTRTTPFPGAPNIPWNTYRTDAIEAAIADFQLARVAAVHLVDAYGSRWRDVLRQAQHDPRRTGLIEKGEPIVWAQLHYGVQEEDVQTLSDFLLRRTSLGKGHPKPEQLARRVAGKMADLLGWSTDMVEQQVATFCSDAKQFDVPTNLDEQLFLPARPANIQA